MSVSVSTPSILLGISLVSEVWSGHGGGCAYRATWSLNGKLVFYSVESIVRAYYLVYCAVGVTYSTATIGSTSPIRWECTRDKSSHSKRLVVQRLRMGLASMLRKGLSIFFHRELILLLTHFPLSPQTCPRIHSRWKVSLGSHFLWWSLKWKSMLADAAPRQRPRETKVVNLIARLSLKVG